MGDAKSCGEWSPHERDLPFFQRVCDAAKDLVRVCRRPDIGQLLWRFSFSSAVYALEGAINPEGYDSLDPRRLSYLGGVEINQEISFGYTYIVQVHGTILKACGWQEYCRQQGHRNSFDSNDRLIVDETVAQQLEIGASLIEDGIAQTLGRVSKTTASGRDPARPNSLASNATSSANSVLEMANKIVIVATAGELWKAYAEGKQACFQSSGISIRPGRNTPTITCTDDAAEENRNALDRAQALVTVEGGDKASAMEKLIARVQLQAGMDKASVINMPLAEFVAVLTSQVGRFDGIGQTLESLAERLLNPDISDSIAEADRGIYRSGGEPAEAAGEAGPDSIAGFLGGAALANVLGIHATRRDAFFRQLERQRMSLGDDCWHEVRDPRPNSPRFLYRADSLKLRELATEYKTPKPA